MADSKISDMTAAGTLTGDELVPIVQGGANKKVTVATLLAAAGAGSAGSLPISAQTGAHTLEAADVGKVVRVAAATSANVEVPTNASVALAVGTLIPVRQAGAGQVIAIPAAGVTLNLPTGKSNKTAYQGAELVLHKVATDEWDVLGQLSDGNASWLGHRYWRIVVSALNAGNGGFVTIRELELLVGTTDQTTGLGTSATQTGNGAAGSASAAVDNDTGTEAGSAWTGSYTWSIDLGAARPIEALTLTGSADSFAPRDFTIEYADASTGPWTVAKTVTNQTGWAMDKRTFTL